MSGPNVSITYSIPACFTFFPMRTAFTTCAGSRPSSTAAGVCSCFVSVTPPRERKDRDASRSPNCARLLPMAGKSNPSSPCASKSALSIDNRELSRAKTRAAGSSSPAAWHSPRIDKHRAICLVIRPTEELIWDDDIGQSDLSVYSKGLTGYKTPSIDRIVDEGMVFADCYGEQSSTAGRSLKHAAVSPAN